MMDGAIKISFLDPEPDHSFTQKDDVNNLNYTTFGIDVAVVGIGATGRQAIFDSSLLKKVGEKNSLIGNLLLCDASIFEKYNDYSIYNRYIHNELKESDLLFSLGDMNDNASLETACSLADKFDIEKSNKKHSLCVYYDEISQETLHTLNQHYDTVIKVNDKNLLGSPVLFLCVTMLQCGFVGIDWVDALFMLRKISIGYYDDFVVRKHDIQGVIDTLSTRFSSNGLNDKKQIVADVWLTVSENISLDDIDNTMTLFSALIQKDIVWSASFEPNLEKDKIQITMVYGVDNGVKDWTKSDG